MKEFLDVICSKWNDFTDIEKDIIANAFFIKNGIEVKDGDIILAKIPIDKETGMYLLDFDLLENEYYAIKQTFKNNKVLMTPLDIEIISKEKDVINA